MPPTITDVAKKAEVSKTTVSRVLAHTPGFKYSSKTTQKVIDAARELSYKPSPAAQLMRLKETKMVGIVIQSVSTQFIQIQTEKCSKEVRKLDYEPILMGLTETYNLYGATPLHRFDYLSGIICQFSVHARSVFKFCSEHNIDAQILSLGYAEDLKGKVRVVASDHSKGIKNAVKYLYDLGHRNIAYVLYCPSGAHDPKHIGFKESICDFGMKGTDIDSSLVEENRSPFKGAFQAAAFLERNTEITAVICQNDESALGLMSALKGKGIRVPEDISVIGYDDLPFAAYAAPALTTIHQKIDEITHNAAKLLISCIEASEIQKDYIPQNIFIEPRLIVRESTRAPNKKRRGRKTFKC